MNGFPKWLYHKTEGGKIVNSQEEESALVGEWKDTPAAFAQESVSKPLATEDETKPKTNLGQATEAEAKPVSKRTRASKA